MTKPDIFHIASFFDGDVFCDLRPETRLVAFIIQMAGGFEQETAQFLLSAEKIYFQDKILPTLEFSSNLGRIFVNFASKWLI